jgi:hypothetical protein
MGAALTTLLGGTLAIAGGLVGIGLSDRRERSRWLRDAQLQASTNLLSALQLLVRRMADAAWISEREDLTVQVEQFRHIGAFHASHPALCADTPFAGSG